VPHICCYITVRSGLSRLWSKQSTHPYECPKACHEHVDCDGGCNKLLACSKVRLDYLGMWQTAHKEIQLARGACVATKHTVVGI
jgi:hypothetical protein